MGPLDPDLAQLKKMAFEECDSRDATVAMRAFCVLIGELRSIKKEIWAVTVALDGIRDKMAS